MRDSSAVAERWQVLAPLPQRRDHDLDHIEPVVQVLPEAAGLYIGRQIPVGGAHDAHIHRVSSWVEPRGRTLALLDGPQQLGLHGQGQIADFVQEQGAARVRPGK